MKSIFIFTILFFFGVSLQVVAQCSNTFPMATGSLTPPGVGQSTSVKYGAGQYVLAYCQAGASYTVTTCGTFAIIGYDEFGDPIYDGFDSQLTVYAADGSLLAYNDDFCGLQSQASFTSSKCQFVRIVLTQYYCNGSGLQMTVKMTQNTAPSLPSTPAVTPTAPICNNTKATLTATCSDNLKWYDASGANLQFSGSPFVTPNLLENTTYKVRCENATTACVSDFAEVVVTVKPANKTVYVNKLNTSGTYDGNNWTTAFSNLQDALAASCAGYQIWVAAGTYKPDEGAGYTLGNRNHSFSMKNGVSILGGFPNDGSGTLTNRNWAANPTILSGDIDNDATLANNSYTVVTSLEVGNSAVLNGFTITGGYANEPYNDNTNPSNSGGGMYNQRSSPVIMNCIFSKNTVSYEGGGMYNDDSYPIITNCFFFKNSATVGVGGGMRNQNGASPVLTNCTFSGNIATNGGGMFNGLQSSPSLTNCIFWGNSSEILNNFNNFTINRSIIQGGYTPCNNCPNGNGNTNPLFVDANGGNLRLQPCSPAINAGDPTTTSATVGNLDLANNPRFFNDGTVDIGAYEFQGNAITQPSASASTTTAVICSGNTINLSASGGGSFSWAGPSGSNFSSTDQNPSFMGSSTSYSGLYSVSVSNANCPVTATATVSVKVNQGLNNPQVSPVAPLCSGASLLFSASGGSSYSWAGPANFSSALQNPSRSTATITMAGTYSVTVSAGAGCASVLTVSVQIYAAVTALSKSSNSPVCQGNTLQLSASGGSFYSWRAPDGFTSTEQNPARPSASAGMSGLYSVTVGNGGTCTVSATLSVSVQAAALSVNPNPLNVCIGQTINLSANASPAASAFSWKGLATLALPPRIFLRMPPLPPTSGFTPSRLPLVRVPSRLPQRSSQGQSCRQVSWAYLASAVPSSLPPRV
ncbi:MAG: choice-of-anchor Q domain-containing protein [Spirosomataceae bacterium]